MNDAKSTELETPDTPLPHYTASGAPVRFGDRLAFTVWTICILLVLAYSLFSYLFSWFGPAIAKPQ